MKLNKFAIYYGVGLLITFIVMLLILLTGETSLYLTFLIFFWVVKFLSGFGLILSITNGFLFILSKKKETLSKRGANIIVIFQIIVPILLILYAIYKIISSYIGNVKSISMTGVWTEIFVFIDNLVFIYGIVSLLLQLYILPIIKKEFDAAINKGRNQKWGQSLRNFGRNVKKQWLSWRDEDAKVKYLDQKSIKELLDNWRDRFAVILLIPLAIGSLLFTPISFILIIMWGKIIIWNRTQIKLYEKIALLLSIIVIGAIAIISSFFDFGIYSQIAEYLWTINIFYLIGIIVATLLFMVKLLSLQGVSISGYFKNRRKQKKEQMKDKIKNLKQQKKSLQKKVKKTPPKETKSVKKKNNS
ncbi:MAG: hypothetical protein ACTSR8_18565 [Promethearchaeota archaeon]